MYKTMTGKHGLGIKHKLQYKTPTADCGLGINTDYGLLG